MADVIRVKRSDITATPSSLAAGELAYSEASGNFFYGRISDGTPVVVGGKTDHDKLTGIEAGAEVNQTDSEIKTQYENNADTNAYTDSEKSKLNGIEAGAEVNTVDSVAGKTGIVTLDSGDITDFSTAVDTEIAQAVLNDLNNVSVATPSNDQVLTYNATSSEWEAQAIPSGVTTFTALNDTPSSFTGSAGFFVKVNSAADALEYVSGIDGGTF